MPNPIPLNPCYQHFQTAPASQHTHVSNKSPIQLQEANVPLEIQHKLNTMLTNKFAEIISKSPTDFGQTNLIEMELPNTGPPVSTEQYTLSLKYKAFVDEEIKLLEDARCIFRSLSDWGSPICIVKKMPDPSHSDKLCMCINYRKVNQSLITAHNNSNGKVVSTFPLPKIQELLSHLNKCKYFSSLDLRSGYYHISLTEKAKKKTAFITTDGHRISANSLEPLPEKLKAIKNLAPARNVEKAHHILRLLGYYRSFIPAFADITLPKIHYLYGLPSVNKH